MDSILEDGTMKETTFSTWGNKKFFPKGKTEARASYGSFYIVGKRVEYTVCDMDFHAAEDAFSDDLQELVKGNVCFQ